MSNRILIENQMAALAKDYIREAKTEFDKARVRLPEIKEEIAKLMSQMSRSELLPTEATPALRRLSREKSQLDSFILKFHAARILAREN